MKKLRPVLPILIIVLVFAVLLISRYLWKERIETYPDDTVGNTAGNLNNGGYFCESDGAVYFANFYDHGTLYRMNPDESDIKKLNNQTIRFLNAAGDHLYYYLADSRNGSDLGSVLNTTGLYRSDTSGKNLTCLKRGIVDTPLLAGNSVFFVFYEDTKKFTMHRISTLGEDDQLITDYLATPACANGTSIYFHGTQDDHNLYRLDTLTNEISRIWDGSLWNPVYSDGCIYYMDLSKHYALSRLNLSTGTVETLTTDRVELFNVSADYVFYQTVDREAPALKRINKDGSGMVTLAEGVYHNLCLTSQYLYFNAYGDDTTMYHCAIGSDYPQEFTAAHDVLSESDR